MDCATRSSAEWPPTTDGTTLLLGSGMGVCTGGVDGTDAGASRLAGATPGVGLVGAGSVGMVETLTAGSGARGGCEDVVATGVVVVAVASISRTVPIMPFAQIS